MIEYSLPFFEVALEHRSEGVDQLVQSDSVAFVEIEHPLQHGREFVGVALLGLCEQSVHLVDVRPPAAEVVHAVDAVVEVGHLQSDHAHRKDLTEFCRLAWMLLPLSQRLEFLRGHIHLVWKALES